MKSFKSFIKEETMPYANVKSGVMDINDSAVRDQINQLLAGATGMKFVTPYIGMERVAKTLANFHIFIPSQAFLEGDSGNAVWPVSQYGLKFGQTNDGDVVAGPTTGYSIYFEYRMSDCGMFMIFCEIVDQDELDEILDDLEDELNGEDEDVELDEESGYYYGKQPVSELKMSDEQQMDEVSSALLNRAMKKAGNEASWLASAGPQNKQYKKRLGQAKKFQKVGMEKAKKEMEKVEEGEESTDPDDKFARDAYGHRAPAVKKTKDGKYHAVNAAGEHRIFNSEAAAKKHAHKTDEGEESLDDINKKIDWHQQAMANAQYKGPQNTFHRKKLQALLAKKKEKKNLTEISSTLVGKLKKAVDLEGKKLKTDKAKETLRKGHKKKWLKSNVGVMKEDQLDELSKGTLASYIKKASHDIATKSAATGRYAERANKEQDARKKGDYSGYQQGRKDNAFADKMFAKSWKRRANIALAADKLAKEETQLDEVSDKLKARYVKKAEKDKSHAERQASHAEYTASHSSSPERKASFKDEAQWLKGIAAKRAKGIALAKKKD